jgi:anti-sigma regulatory factor (Ser/Thr protein kinase)
VGYEPLPVEDTRPAVELDDPAPVRARAAVRALAHEHGLGPEACDGLVSAVSEVVTNAHSYGRPPVRLRAWVDGPHVVVVVTDQGHGPGEPLDLAVPPARPQGEGGFGLWIAAQLCQAVALGQGPDGFAVRLVSR